MNIEKLLDALSEEEKQQLKVLLNLDKKEEILVLKILADQTKKRNKDLTPEERSARQRRKDKARYDAEQRRRTEALNKKRELESLDGKCGF
jgi:hypothetical protein